MTLLPTATDQDGLVLRTWTAADVPALARAIETSTEHLRPWMAWIAHEPQTLEQRSELVARWEREHLDGGDAVFGIWRDDTVVGSCGLHRRIGAGGLEIGYWVHVDHVGRGIATTASRALTDLAFTVDGIDVVEIRHDRTNAASRRVPEKLGYTWVGEAAPNRAESAPAETGVDGLWRTTRATWPTPRG